LIPNRSALRCAGKQLFKMSSATKLVEPHSVLTQDDAGFISWQTDDLVPTPVSTRA